MFGRKKFYDKYWNFDNTKFLELLEKARKEKLKKAKKWPWFQNKEIMLFSSVSKKEMWQFINKLAIFLNSWIDIKWALAILVKQTKNPYLKNIVSEIRQNIDYWISISETMSNYPKVFDNLTVSLIWVWEKTWQLWVILNELDKTLLENIELKSKVKWAMMYPMILLGLTITMVIFMMVFIIPRITESFNKTGTELPKLTQYVINVSHFLWWYTKKWEDIKFNNDWSCKFYDYKFEKNNRWEVIKTPIKTYFWETQTEKWKKMCRVSSQWFYLLLFIIALVIAMKLFNKTYIWKNVLARIAIKLPIFGYIVKQSNVIYFIKAFTLLQNAWVLLLDALKTSSKVVPNLLYKKELIRIKNEVEIWLTISKSLWLNLEYESNVYMNELFSEEFAYVVSTGEETWSLSKSLEKIGKNYTWELKRYIGNMSSMMEPIIIVIVWALVWIIVVAIMLPFFELAKVAKNM